MGALKRRRWLLAPLALVIASALFEQVGAWRDRARFPAAGTRVDIGDGRALYLECRGQGSPTVVFEAGHDNWSPSWSAVLPEVAKHTRACSYDRAGLGQSDAAPAPSADASRKDLEKLLAHAGIAPPYVLVGHSAGGMLARLFFAAHPDQVVGMVLVDTDEPTDDADRREVGTAPDNLRAQRFLTLAVYTGLLRFATQVLGVALDPNEKRYPEEARVRMRGAMGNLARHMNDEWLVYQSAYVSVTDRSLESRPLVVIGALGYLKTKEDRDDRRARQERLAKRSTTSRLVMLESSDHFVPLLQPEIVIDAVTTVLAQIR